MVPYVQNKIIKFTIIVDITILGFNAHCMRPKRLQSAVHSPFALKTCCAFATRGGGPRVVVSTVAFHARVRGSVPSLSGLKETKMFLPHPRVKLSIVGSLRDREVAC